MLKTRSGLLASMHIPGLKCPRGVCGQVNIRVLVAASTGRVAVFLRKCGGPSASFCLQGQELAHLHSQDRGEWGAGGRRGRRGNLQLYLLFLSENGAPDPFWVWPVLLAGPGR